MINCSAIVMNCKAHSIKNLRNEAFLTCFKLWYCLGFMVWPTISFGVLSGCLYRLTTLIYSAKQTLKSRIVPGLLSCPSLRPSMESELSSLACEQFSNCQPYTNYEIYEGPWQVSSFKEHNFLGPILLSRANLEGVCIIYDKFHHTHRLEMEDPSQTELADLVLEKIPYVFAIIKQETTPFILNMTYIHGCLIALHGGLSGCHVF